MRGSRIVRAIMAVLAVGVVLVGAVWCAPLVSAQPYEPGIVPVSQYVPAGPHETVSTAAVYPCGSLYAVYNGVSHIFGNRSEMPCTHAFPAGFDSPTGVDFYYPKDIGDLSRVPTIIWVPGFTNNPGNYDATARLWASQGWVVAIPYDFLNSLATLPLAAAAALSKANHDPANVLSGKLDLSRTVVGGHSGGGAAAVSGAAIPADIYQLIDPEFRVIGAVPTESSPAAPNFLVGVPTLYLTGSMDFLVPDFIPRWTEYELNRNAPAFIAGINGANHFTPWDDPAHNPMAGITLAWLRYLVDGDKTAASYFTGPGWRLRADPAVGYAIRNGLADALPG